MFDLFAGIWRKQSIAIVAVLLFSLGASSAASASLPVGPGKTFQTNYIDLPAGGKAAGQSGVFLSGQPERSPTSSDGRYVAFDSAANTLDPAANPDVDNVYRKDRTTGEVELVSRATGANGTVVNDSSFQPKISGDGNLVGFLSKVKLDPADTDDEFDAYIRNVTTDVTTLATPGTVTPVFQFDLSANGQFIAFSCTDPLVPGDLNAARPDVYRRNLASGVIDLVSKKAVSGDAGNDSSYNGSISGDGKWVAYSSAATDLVAGFVDNNMIGGLDVFVRDMSGVTNHLVSSRFDSLTQGSNGNNGDPVVAGTPGPLNAVKVTYYGEATNVALPGIDAAPLISVYLKPMSGTASTLVSVSDSEVNADNQAALGSPSDDGNLIAFTSSATNFGNGDDGYGIYLRNVSAGTTTLISKDNVFAEYGDISGNGALASWTEINGSADSDPDALGVFTRTLPGGPIEFASRPPGTVPYLLPAAEVSYPVSGSQQISADGRYVVFTSASHRLVSGVGGRPTVYRRDLQTGEIVLVSRATGATGAVSDGALHPSISADGSKVAFIAFSSLTPADNNTEQDIYVRDVTSNTTTLVSRADGANGLVGDAFSETPAISGDGNSVAFSTESTNLGNPGVFEQIYVRDLVANKTTLISRTNGEAGAIGNGQSESPKLSRDGKTAVYESRAFNLVVPDDPNNGLSIYVRDLNTNVTTLASRREGLAGVNAAGENLNAVISGDGKVVAWETADQTVAPEAGAWPALTPEVVSRTLATGANKLVSRAAGGAPANKYSTDATIDGDGSEIAFSTNATNLLPSLGGVGHQAVFVRDSATGVISGPPAFGIGDQSPGQGAEAPSLSENGQCLAFIALGHNDVSGDSSDINSQYVYVVSGTCTDPRSNPPAETPKPVLTKVSLTNKKFAVSRKKTAAIAARKKAKKGTKIKFTLNVNASVTIRIEKKVAGRKVKGKCVKVRKANRKKKKCSRFVKAGKLVRKTSKAGANTVAFSGRIGNKKLKPGKYRAVLTAYNATGASNKVSRPFKIVSK